MGTFSVDIQIGENRERWVTLEVVDTGASITSAPASVLRQWTFSQGPGSRSSLPKGKFE